MLFQCGALLNMHACSFSWSTLLALQMLRRHLQDTRTGTISRRRLMIQRKWTRRCTTNAALLHLRNSEPSYKHFAGYDFPIPQWLCTGNHPDQ